jgi:hypothetical protein
MTDLYWSQNGDDAEPSDRLDGDVGPGVLDEELARQPVAAVDEHRVRAAHAVGAGSAEGQRAVLVPLHLVEQVEHPVGRLGADRVLLPVRLGVELGVEAANAQRDVHGHAQYVRALGSNLVTVTGR